MPTQLASTNRPSSSRLEHAGLIFATTLAVVLGAPANASAHPEPTALRLAPTTISSVAGDAGARDRTRVRFQLARRSLVDVSVYSGSASVRRLYRGWLPGGARSVMWKGVDARGQRARPGSYVVRLVIANRHARTVQRARITVNAPATVDPSLPALAWPLDGPVASPFGPRGGRPHHGIDITAPAGRPIRAAAAGTVTQAGDQRGYGRTIVVKHVSGFSTLYAHQSRLAANAGDRVAAGQTIGYVGQTGDADGNHLHLELRTPQNVPVDPLGALPSR